jgi:hypothetical protein
MAKAKRKVWREEQTARRHSPRAAEHAEQQQSSVVSKSPAARLQQQIGNQGVQRVLAQRQGAPGAIRWAGPQGKPVQREKKDDSAETLTSKDRFLSSPTSNTVTAFADWITVLDTGLQLASFAELAIGGGLLAELSTIGAPIAFVAAMMYGLASAYKTGERIAAVLGESYAIVALANKQKQLPRAPGDMAAGAAFNSAAQQAKKRLSATVAKRDANAAKTLASLASMAKKDPEKELNRIYQHLVREHLQARFLGFKMGGRLYHIAKDFTLTWPEVKWVAK